MAAALKMGFVKEMGFKSSPKVCLDEFLSLNAENAASSSDYFFVDQLLNFSNDEDGFMEEEEAEEAEEKNIHHSFSVSANSLQQHHENDENSNHSSTSSEDDFWPVSSRDSEDLEWLSHLVADSSQEYSAPPSCVFLTEKSNNNQNEIKITRQHLHPLLKFGISSMEPHLKIPFPSKPRSQRARISGRVWSFVSPLRSDMSSRGSVSVTSSSSCSSLSIPWLNYHHPLEKVPAKKPKKKSTVESSVRVQPARRCSHCGVQKTPQWRAGPLGGKTLCNACGVRFKSGRLFPEYRPACSPTFSSELHSNHHRKVLEMRRQKETEKHHSGPDPDPTVKEPEERTRFKERPSLVCK